MRSVRLSKGAVLFCTATLAKVVLLPYLRLRGEEERGKERDIGGEEGPKPLYWPDSVADCISCIYTESPLPITMICTKLPPRTGHAGGEGWGSNSRGLERPGAPPVFNMFLTLLYDNRILRVYWTLLLWMMFLGRARHFPLGPLTLVLGFLTLVVGFRMWKPLYRLVLAWSREIAAQLRSASVSLAPACWDATPRCHAGVGDVILRGASLALPSFATPAFR